MKTKDEVNGERTMPLLKLTEQHYVNPDLAGKVIFDVEYGLPHFEFRYRNGQWKPTDLYGNDAEQAWANWTAHVEGRTA